MPRPRGADGRERHPRYGYSAASSRSAAGIAQPKPSPRSTRRWPRARASSTSPVQHQRMGPGHVDQHRDCSLGRRRLGHLVDGHRHRTGPGVPGLQRVQTGEAEHGLATVRPLQHDHGHLGLLVRRQPADGGADLRRRRHDRHQQPVTTQRRDGPQVVGGLVRRGEPAQRLPDARLGCAVVAGERRGGESTFVRGVPVHLGRSRWARRPGVWSSGAAGTPTP